MSNYTKTTDFEAKDSLPTGDSGKIIRGAEFETEFDAISTAIATKADTAGPTFTGTLTFETISDGTIGVTAFVDEDDMSSDSATLVPTQQSVKAYVDSQVTAQDLDFQADTGGALSIDLDSETMTFTGGTGIDTSGSGNAVTFAIDSTVATLTGTQTLTNKTLTAPTISGNLTTDGTIDGRDVATDGAKLDGIEAGATADQTAAEIRTLVDSATDSNVFTDADHTKLDGIEAGATGDQTNAEIRAAVEAATDSNVFTDADHSKLDGIEASADVTDTANVTAAGALMDSELTSEASVKALNQGVATTDSPTFAGVTVNGTVEFDGLSGTGAVSVTDILDQDDMSSNSATALATQQSIKAYVDSQVATVDTLAEVLGNGNATGGTDIAVGTGDDITFADSSKAIFGAGSDLQIYHDGSNSYIWDNGTGLLQLRTNGSEISLVGQNGTEFMGRFQQDGAVKLYYDNDQKFATTSTGIDVTGGITSSGNLTVNGADVTITANVIHSGDNDTYFGFNANDSYRVVTGGSQRLLVNSTGIDVTGTVTADGILSSGDITITESTPSISFVDSDGTNQIGKLRQVADTVILSARNNTAYGNFKFTGEDGSTEKTRLQINGVTGDISFYEDTGTTAKLFWDASAEALRIGGTSNVGVSEAFTVYGDSSNSNYPLTSVFADTSAYNASSPVAGGGLGFAFKYNTGGSYAVGSLITGIKENATDGNYASALTFQTRANGANPVERMRIDSSGNVGIGTSSPAELLHVHEDSTGVARMRLSNTEGYLEIGTNNQVSNLDSETHTFRNEAGSTEYMRIDSSGQVGIGTSSPADKAHVNGGNVQIQNSNASLILTDSGNSNYKWLLQSISSGLRFYNSSGSSEAMRIDSSGNVGIGTSTVHADLHLGAASPHIDIGPSTGNRGKVGFDSNNVYIGSTSGTGEIHFKNNIGSTVAPHSSGDTKMVITDSGVGIGTSPASGVNLHLHEAGSGQMLMAFTNDTTGTGSNDGLHVGIDSSENAFVYNKENTALYFGTNNAERMRIDSSGNVEIKSGGELVTYRGDNARTGKLYTDNNAMTLLASHDPIKYWADDTGYHAFGFGSDTTANEKMRLTYEGNLLVGTTNTTPAFSSTGSGIALKSGESAISADGTLALILNRNTSDGEIQQFRKGGSTVGSIGVVSSDRMYFSTADGLGLQFDKDNNRITPCAADGSTYNNNVSLGASSLEFKDLYLSGTAYASGATFEAATPTLRLQGTTNTNKNISIFYNESSDYAQINSEEQGVNQKDLWITGLNLKFGRSTSSESARIDSSGNLLVGASSFSFAGTSDCVQISGTEGRINIENDTTSTAYAVAFYNTNGLVGRISTSGSATAYVTSSDQRLKDNIVDAPSASDDIDAIQVRSFDWKADGSHQKYGMVAQELQSVAPEAVTGDADSDDMMGVDYSKLVPMLVKEIQSLRARVAQLEGEN
jgi:hypothetical protein